MTSECEVRNDYLSIHLTVDMRENRFKATAVSTNLLVDFSLHTLIHNDCRYGMSKESGLIIVTRDAFM